MTQRRSPEVQAEHEHARVRPDLSRVPLSSGRRAGVLLRAWRCRVRLSQLELAARAQVSTRHISCLENGRSAGTRDMLARLSDALALSARDRNALFLAAGYAPVHAETCFQSPEMGEIRGLLAMILERQEPYAALVMNAGYDLLLSNRPAQAMTAMMCADTQAVLADGPANLLRVLCHPQGIRASLANWPQVVSAVLGRVRRELELDPLPAARELMAQVLRYPDVRACLGHAEIGAAPALLIPLVIRARIRGEDTRPVEIRLTTTVSTLGTALDITLQDLRIESYYPVDAESGDRFVRWAAGFAA